MQAHSMQSTHQGRFQHLHILCSVEAAFCVFEGAWMAPNACTAAAAAVFDSPSTDKDGHSSYRRPVYIRNRGVQMSVLAGHCSASEKQRLKPTDW